jgi:hypothetical protein
MRCSRLKSGRSSLSAQPGSALHTIVPLRDEDQPFIYDIRFSRRKFTLELYDTANPNQHWSSLRPDVVVLAYDISNRNTLDGLTAVLSSSLHPKEVSMLTSAPFYSGGMILPDTSSMAMASDCR